MSRSARSNAQIFRLFGFGILALGALGGCASSPRIEYFALEPVASQGPAIASATTIIQVAQVHVPPSLDRQEMVRHRGPFSLDVSDRHRWSAPLDEMIRRVLSQDLMQVLPPGSVVLAEEPAPPDTRKIVVNVLQFAPDAHGWIQFEGTWSVVSSASRETQSRLVRLSERADASATADQVKGMSRILARLAELMAQALAVSPR